MQTKDETERTTQQASEHTLVKMRVLALIPCGIALNLALGTLIHTLKLPVYVDAVGTIAVTLLAGLRAGLAVGVSSFLIGGVLTNPVLPWFAGTQACIALYTYVVGRRGWFSISRPTDSGRAGPKVILRYLRPIIAGIGLGIVSGVVSAPVIVLLFGGLTGSGTSLLVAFLLKSGQKIFDAVLLSGLASEPLDKTLQILIALAMLRSLPRSLKTSFGGGLLHRNNLLGTL